MEYDDNRTPGRILPIVKGQRWRASSWPPAPPSPPQPSPPRAVPAMVWNGQTRTTEDGEPLNAHQGSMVFDPRSRRFFLFGNFHRDCISMHHCHCAGVDEGWTVTTGIGIYSAPSAAGPWRYEAGPVLPPFNQPRVVGPIPTMGNGTASDGSAFAVQWRMYVQFPLRLVTAPSPGGPWVLAPSVVSLDHNPQDMNAMLDESDGRVYLIFTSSVDYRIRVQRLSMDGTKGMPGETSEPFGPHPCEAPVLFRYGWQATYFALFGHNWYVPQRAPQPSTRSAPLVSPALGASALLYISRLLTMRSAVQDLPFDELTAIYMGGARRRGAQVVIGGPYFATDARRRACYWPLFSPVSSRGNLL